MKYKPAPFQKGFWTPGVLVLLSIILCGGVFAVARFRYGLGYVTNLSNAHPWGLWVGLDIAAGVALAAGGFTVPALVFIFGRRFYEPVFRTAILTALLGYSFEVLSVVLDLGRYRNFWHPLVFWQPNSPLFAISVCVTLYLAILYFLFIPMADEQYGARCKTLRGLAGFLNKIMWLPLLAGVVIAGIHQTTLGSLMLIAPTKMHPLWYTGRLPLLFLLSALAVGFPMVVFESIIAANTFRRASDMDILAPLGRITIFLLGLYLIIKMWDLYDRGAVNYLFNGSTEGNSFLVEVAIGGILPWLMLLIPAIRRSRRGLFFASSLIVGGVILNRINVFLVAYNPPYAHKEYFPAIGELAIAAALVAGLMLMFRVGVAFFPLLPARERGLDS